MDSGSIKVFVDDEAQPRFSVVDKTFKCGQVGLGSFDETGDYTDVKLTSTDAGCDRKGSGRGAARTIGSTWDDLKAKASNQTKTAPFSAALSDLSVIMCFRGQQNPIARQLFSPTFCVEELP